MKKTDRIAKQIETKFMAMGVAATCDSSSFQTARNVGRIVYDPMSWQGFVRVGGLHWSIGSRDTMTKCLKDGFIISDQRYNCHREVDFQIDVIEFR